MPRWWLGVAELERLLVRTAHGGFVRVPDDPCAQILPFTGGGSHPTQSDVDFGGHHYDLRWRYGFSIELDDETVLECDLARWHRLWDRRDRLRGIAAKPLDEAHTCGCGVAGLGCWTKGCDPSRS